MKKILPTKSNFMDIGWAYFGAAAYVYMESTIPAWLLLAAALFVWLIAAIMDFVEWSRAQQTVDRTDASPNST